MHGSQSDIQAIAITGTNGKTTVAYWLYQVLGEQGAYIGTLGAKTNAMGDFEYTGFTTPDDKGLIPWLERFKKERRKWLSIEASSHGLKQHRIKNLDVRIAVFLNLTRDHLDYHKTLEDYFESKALLFNRSELEASIVNIDDEYGLKLLERLHQKRTITFSINNTRATVHYKTIASNHLHHQLSVQVAEELVGLTLPKQCFIATQFNLSNLLAVIAVAKAIELPLQGWVQQIAQIGPPPGRLQPIDEGQGFDVYIDFAHTPDALENLLENLNQVKNGQLIAIYGCGGKRDIGKRAQMAKVGVSLADKVIFTSDNPRDEVPEKIIDDMLEGVLSTDVKYTVEVDREKAIRKGLAMANIGDTLVIAGKGHETQQEIAGVKYPFNDALVASKYLREMTQDNECYL